MNNNLIENENNILFYTDEEGHTNIEVVLDNDDVWLNANALASLFDVQRPAITKHINNIYNEEELNENSTCSKWNMWVITDKIMKRNIIILI